MFIIILFQNSNIDICLFLPFKKELCTRQTQYVVYGDRKNERERARKKPIEKWFCVETKQIAHTVLFMLSVLFQLSMLCLEKPIVLCTCVSLCLNSITFVYKIVRNAKQN